MCIQRSDFLYKPLAQTTSATFFYPNLNLIKNPEKTIKLYFSIIYEYGYFITAIYSTLVEYDGFSTEGCYWYYPDMNSPFPEDKFEGVYFSVGFNDPEQTVYVSEQISFKYAREACEHFWGLHPEHKDFLSGIINKWKPLNQN